MENDIVFCTTYLSVGVSIYNKEKACIIFFGENWTAYQIEQYACRFRNTDITVLWIINNKYIESKETDFRLIKIPSEEEIETVIECTKRELNYRGWENWDIILKNTLDAYPGIIKENMFEMNELYYDRVSLYLSWYVYSLNKYYKNIMNNIKELHDYSFNIVEENITCKNKLNTKEKELYDDITCKINAEQGKKLLQWIDYLSDYYFLQGKLEMNFFGETIYREPYISFHRFAMYCWYNGLTINNIKDLLHKLIIEVHNKKMYDRCMKKIDTAKRSIERAQNKPDNNKHKERDLMNAQQKLDEAQQELKEIPRTYDIKTSEINRLKQLIRIAKHSRLENISRLLRFVKESVDKIAVDRLEDVSNECNINDVVDRLAVKYNKMVNAPKYINFDTYLKELKHNIEKFIRTMYNVGGDYIFSSWWSKNSPDIWFEIDENRSLANTSVHKDILLLINSMDVYRK